VSDKPGFLQAPARTQTGPVGPLGVLVLARWRWLLPVVGVLIVGWTDLGHRHPLDVTVTVWLFMASGVAAYFTRDRAERALHDRRFGRTPLAWVHVVCLLGLFGTSAALAFLQTGATGPVGLFIAIMSTFRLLPLLATTALALVTACVVGLSESVGHGTALNGALSGFLFAAAFAIVTLIVWARIGNEQATAMEQRAVALAERQRLAREMHDVLAHSLSGLMLQLEGARMLAKENPADPRLPEIIERAHHLGKTGLDEARRAIGMLRDDDLPGPEQLGALVEQFQRDSGIPCELAVSGAAHELDSEVRLAIYRVAQEALTNVRKHAHPQRVEARLVYTADRTCLTVEDFGANGTRSPIKDSAVKDSGGGYGLTGMRERAELLGGSLTAASTGSGFRVELQVPA
jgi:signal transduction histidine kinase